MSFARSQLLEGERIIVAVHRHPVTLAGAVLVNLVSALVLGVLAAYVGRYWVLALLLVPLAYLAWEILVRQLTEFVVTDRRIVRHEGVFSISSFDSPLDKINNVFHQQTIAGRLLNYGTVGVETASEQGTTLFETIPQPVRFKNTIVQQREAFRQASHGHGSSAPSAEVPKLLEELASLRDRGVLTAAEFEDKKKALLDRI